EYARDQKRAHLENGGADRVTLLAKQVPKHDGEFFGFVVETHVLGALYKFGLGFAASRNAREVAFAVGGKGRHARTCKAFCQNLQGYRLAGAGRTGGKAVTIGDRQRQKLIVVAFADEDFAVTVGTRHHLSFSSRVVANQTSAFRLARLAFAVAGLPLR